MAPPMGSRAPRRRAAPSNTASRSQTNARAASDLNDAPNSHGEDGHIASNSHPPTSSSRFSADRRTQSKTASWDAMALVLPGLSAELSRMTATLASCQEHLAADYPIIYAYMVGAFAAHDRPVQDLDWFSGTPLTPLGWRNQLISCIGPPPGEMIFGMGPPFNLQSPQSKHPSL
jgi:hypothetical protein